MPDKKFIGYDAQGREMFEPEKPASFGSRFADAFGYNATVPLSVMSGITKGAARSAVGAGQIVAGLPVSLPSIGRPAITVADVIDAGYRMFGVKDAETQARLASALDLPSLAPKNDVEKVGMAAERIAEFFLGPSGKAKGAKLLYNMVEQGASSALLSSMQGASPSATTTAGVVGAVVPAAGATLSAAAPLIKSGAERTVVRFMQPTTKAAKVEAQYLAPQIIERGFTDRGVRGFQKGALARAEAAKSAAGKSVGAAEVAEIAAKPGNTVSMKALKNAVDFFERKTLTKQANTAGEITVKPGMEQMNRLAKKYREFIELQGNDISIEHAADLKRTWQEFTSEAKGYVVDLPTKMEARITKRLAAKMRQELLATSPDLKKVYDEFSFYAGLRDVLKATVERKAGQQPVTLGRGWLGATAGGAYAFSQHPDPLVAGGAMILGSGIQHVLMSPAYRLVSGKLKGKLADAIASGRSEAVESAIGQIVKSVPSLSTSIPPVRDSGVGAMTVSPAVSAVQTQAEEVWEMGADGKLFRVK